MKNYIIGLAVMLFMLPNVAFSEQAISKSVFVQLADPVSHDFIPNDFTYFPAGTRLITGKRTFNYRGSIRRLVYSEDGIAAYIKEGMYWGKDEIRDLVRRGGDKWVFISRSNDIIAKISKAVKLVVGFTRGEKYPLVEEGENAFVVRVGNTKIPGFGQDVSFQITIPRSSAKFVDFSQRLTLNEAALFKLSVIDGVSGIKKPCNTKTVIASKHGGKASASVGFSLDKFWLALSAKGEVSAETETKKLEEFDINENVSRIYFTRDGESGLYKITRYKACSVPQNFKYIYTNKDIEEITISKKWAKGLVKDARTSQVVVSCPRQYFEYYDELSGWNFSAEEIAFIISRTARFKSFSSKKCVTQ